tara:strand:+ start:333 stop:512 length:180 start_codon:yes stop_codon:yes gene_type:complete
MLNIKGDEDMGKKMTLKMLYKLAKGNEEECCGSEKTKKCSCSKDEVGCCDNDDEQGCCQ